MTEIYHGSPCWYELTTPDPLADGRFYAAVLGWDLVDAGVPGFDYHIAKAGAAMVAGLSRPMAAGVPTHWLIYFAVSDCDATAAAIVADGGTQRVTVACRAQRRVETGVAVKVTDVRFRKMQVVDGDIATDRHAGPLRLADQGDAGGRRKPRKMQTDTRFSRQLQGRRDGDGFGRDGYSGQSQPRCYLTIMRDTVTGKKLILRSQAQRVGKRGCILHGAQQQLRVDRLVGL